MTTPNDSRYVFETLKLGCWHKTIDNCRCAICADAVYGEITEHHMPHLKCIHCGDYFPTGKPLPNPDYSTAPGFFELKGLCEKQEWWEDFTGWYLRKTARPLQGVNTWGGVFLEVATQIFNLIKDAQTFLTAVAGFLREREGREEKDDK